MANTKAALKSLRQDKKRQARNKSVKSELHTVLKKTRKLLAEKKIEEAEKAIRDLESKYCRAANRNVIKKRNASRNISKVKKELSKTSSAK